MRLDYANNEKAPINQGLIVVYGGEGGIRTLGTLSRTPDFESGTFDHSATSPRGCMVAHASTEGYASEVAVTTNISSGMLPELALIESP
jgi:hypothetical protein